MKHRYDLILEAAIKYKARGFVFNRDIYEYLFTLDPAKPAGKLDRSKLGFDVHESDIKYLQAHQDIIEISQGLYKITDKAELLLTDGGYTSIFAIKKLKKEKLEWDWQLSKWAVRTRWWPLIISIISLIIAIIALVKGKYP